MSHNICTFFDILLIIAANVIKSNDYSDFITRFVRPAKKQEVPAVRPGLLYFLFIVQIRRLSSYGHFYYAKVSIIF